MTIKLINSNLDTLKDKLEEAKRMHDAKEFCDENENTIKNLLKFDNLDMTDQDDAEELEIYARKLQDLLSYLRYLENTVQKSNFPFLEDFVSKMIETLEFRNKHLEIEKFYREKKERFCDAIKWEDERVIREILQNGYERENGEKPRPARRRSEFDKPRITPRIVDMTNKDGELPINLAIKSHNAQIIVQLIYYGADVSLSDDINGDNVLHCISKEAGKDSEIAKNLLTLFLKVPEKTVFSYPKQDFRRIIDDKNNEGKEPFKILMENYNNNPSFRWLSKMFYDLGADPEHLSNNERANLPEEIFYESGDEEVDIFKMI